MKIAIIGANEFQNKLILKCKEKNIETHVFAWEDGAVGKEYCDYFYPVSIVEKEKILDKCKEIGIDGILSIGSDLAMLTVNYVAEELNLIGNTIESTILSTDKFEMRKAFLNNNVSCPKFMIVKENIKDLKNKEIDFPCIVKPTDRSGSRGVTKVEKYEELEIAIKKAINESFNKKVILEQYIGGKEYSMEFISDNGNHTFLAITEKFTTGSPNFIEKAHLQPARINNETLERAIEVAKKGLDALMVKNGASHIEIKIENNNIFIIEIGARMGGDFIGSDLVKLSTGIDFTELVLYKCLDKEIKANKLYNKHSFVYFIFDEEDILKVKNNYNILKPYIVEENIEKKDKYNKVTDSSNRHGYILFQFDKYDEFKEVEKILLKGEF